MVLMRTSSDEVSSVRIRLRANTGQRLAVEDERGGIHLFSLWIFFRCFFYRSHTTKVDFAAAAAGVAAAVIVVIVLNRMTQLDFKNKKAPAAAAAIN